MCKGPEMRTSSLPLRNFKKVAMAGVQGERGRVAACGVWAVDRDQYPQVLKFLIFKMGQ